jgi:hypothetical protein
VRCSALVEKVLYPKMRASTSASRRVLPHIDALAKLDRALLMGARAESVDGLPGTCC